MIIYFKDKGYYLTTFKTYTRQQRAAAVLFNGANVTDFVKVLEVDGVEYFKKIN